MRPNVLRLTLVVGLGACIAGCHHNVPAAAATAPSAPPPAAPAAPPRPPAPAPPAAAAAPAPLSEEELFRRKSLDELNAERPLGDAFFDLDQNELRADARTALQKDAQWLAKWPDTRVSIDGHCDERGSAEYNLALGERRATAVRDYLVSLGVSPNRLATKSLGKESPFCTAEGEGCWSQNRRGHFVITAK
jgi:peptidoglycan-associated lipoprotein